MTEVYEGLNIPVPYKLEHTNKELAEILEAYVENVFDGVAMTDRDAIIAIEASKLLIKNLDKESK